MAAKGLELGLLVGAEDVLVGAQPAAFDDLAYRSRARAAFSAKFGSRGKIHDRTCHGLIASSCSQRQIVDADASVTPRSMTSRCSLTLEKRDNGSSCVRGSSHAIALTSATCCGGKTTRPTRPRLILKALQTLGAKSPSPPSDALR